jgi:hypothetical protein
MNHFDPTDVSRVERAAEESADKQRRDEQIWQGDLKWLMADRRGRRIVSRLLDRAGMQRSSFDTNNASMSFKEGLRWFGIWLKEEIEKHCFDRFIELLKESRE